MAQKHLEEKSPTLTSSMLEEKVNEYYRRVRKWSWDFADHLGLDRDDAAQEGLMVLMRILQRNAPEVLGPYLYTAIYNQLRKIKADGQDKSFRVPRTTADTYNWGTFEVPEEEENFASLADIDREKKMVLVDYLESVLDEDEFQCCLGLMQGFSKAQILRDAGLHPGSTRIFQRIKDKLMEHQETLYEIVYED